jgi:hypothetical protein
MVLTPTSQLLETEWLKLVGLGRVELPTNGLGIRFAEQHLGYASMPGGSPRFTPGR